MTPPSYPSGRFVYIYSFLDRVLQSENGGGPKHIESRYDSTNLESFTRELPNVFDGSVTLNMSTVKVSTRSFLPALPTYKSWEDSRSKKGLRHITKRKMINIKAQVRSHETAILLAVSCLDSTCSFVTSLLSYISDTHQDLIDSEFSEEASW